MSDVPAPVAPPKVLTLGGARLVMSYGMLMDLSRMLPDPVAALTLVMNDSFTQDYIIRRLLTPLDAKVETVDDLIPASEVEFDTDEVEAALSWVVQHILYFFTKRTLGLRAAGERFQLDLPSPSPSGSEPSASPDLSAGPSTA